MKTEKSGMPLIQRMGKSAMLKKSSPSSANMTLAIARLADGVSETDVRKQGVNVVRMLGDFAIIATTLDDAERVASLNLFKSFEFEKTLKQNMIYSRQVTNVDDVHSGIGLTQAYTGKGVVCGIVDNGFDLNHNNFRFSTLPAIKSYASYQYANQGNINVTADENGYVDLSAEAMVGDSATTFRWFVDEPWYDENTGELTGEELYYGEEVDINGGVSRFLSPINNVVCAMVNSMYPNLTLYTNPINVTSTDIKRIASANGNYYLTISGGSIIIGADADAKSVIYSASGALVAKAKGAASLSVAPGVYIIRHGSETFKVAVR